MNRRTFLQAITASFAVFGLSPRKAEAREGDFMVRRSPREQWVPAASFNAIEVGQEFGRFNGHTVESFGPITGKTHYSGVKMWFTQQHVWCA